MTKPKQSVGFYRRRIAPAVNPVKPGMNDVCGNCGEVYGFHRDEFCPHGKGAWQEKPDDQPRFVTIVFPAGLENLENFMGFAHAFREGNALAILDGLEDKVKAAVHEAFTKGN